MSPQATVVSRLVSIAKIHCHIGGLRNSGVDFLGGRDHRVASLFTFGYSAIESEMARCDVIDEDLEKVASASFMVLSISFASNFDNCQSNTSMRWRCISKSSICFFVLGRGLSSCSVESVISFGKETVLFHAL